MMAAPSAAEAKHKEEAEEDAVTEARNVAADAMKSKDRDVDGPDATAAATVDVADDNGDADGDRGAFLANALGVAGAWSVHDDDNGHLFYYNHDTSESQWAAPSELAGLEAEFMMKLMLQGALARSGPWTAHDAGDGTPYYFNEQTRASVWTRPAEWGEMAPVERPDGAPPPPPPPPPPPSRARVRTMATTTTTAAVDKKSPKNNKKKKDKDRSSKGDRLPLGPPTEEELELLRRRAEEQRIYQEHFCELLREKKIMPFCKWSVAFPMIAGDPRFLAVPTMEERMQVFEDFVKNRRDDLKNEKKQKLKAAKKRWGTFVRENLVTRRASGNFDAKLTFSVFNATLEETTPADQWATLQKEVLALLTTAIQEKLWEKEMKDFLESTKAEREEEEKLGAFLLEKLVGRQMISYDDHTIQAVVKSFYQNVTQSKLSEVMKGVVVNNVAKTLARNAAEARQMSAKRSQSVPLEPAYQPPLAVTESNSHPTGPGHYGPSSEGPLDNEKARADRRRSPSTVDRSNVRSRDRGRSRERRSRDYSSRRGKYSSSRSSSRSRSRSRSRRRDRSERHRRRQSSSRSSSRSSRSRSRSRSRHRRRH